MWIIGWCCCCFFCLFQPFMKLWMGEQYMLSNTIVAFYCVYFLVFEMNQICIAYKDAAGIWHDDRLRPLVVSVSNLILNIVLVQIFGISGVLFATIISTLIIGYPWLLRNLFANKFKRKIFPYILQIVRYVAIILVSIVITASVTSIIPDNNIWIKLFGSGILCLFVPNFIYIFAYRNSEELGYIKSLVRKSLCKGGIR